MERTECICNAYFWLKVAWGVTDTHWKQQQEVLESRNTVTMETSKETQEW